MKKTIAITVIALATLVFTEIALSGVASLRGTHDLTASAQQPVSMQQIEVEGGIERSYKIQPPAIPHKIDKDEINLKVNTCMKCHSAATYEQEKAPKAGDSHYEDRNGNKTEKVDSRRYFCHGCHATQVEATPLVENTFQGAK